MKKSNTHKRGAPKGSDKKQSESMKEKPTKKTGLLRWMFPEKRDKKPQGNATDGQARGDVREASGLDQEFMGNDREVATTMGNKEKQSSGHLFTEHTVRSSDNGRKPTKESDGRIDAPPVSSKERKSKKPAPHGHAQSEGLSENAPIMKLLEEIKQKVTLIANRQNASGRTSGDLYGKSPTQSELDDRESRHVKEMKECKDRYENQLKDLGRDHETELDKLKCDLEEQLKTELKEKQSEYESEMGKLKKKHEEKIDQIGVEHKREGDQLKKDHEGEIGGIRDEHELKVDQLNKAARDLKEDIKKKEKEFSESFWPSPYAEKETLRDFCEKVQASFLKGEDLGISLYAELINSGILGENAQSFVNRILPLGKALYSWINAGEYAGENYDSLIAGWLTERLEDRKVHAVQLNEGFNSKMHDCKLVNGSKVSKVESFLVMGQAGRIERKAIVEVN